MIILLLQNTNDCFFQFTKASAAFLKHRLVTFYLLSETLLHITKEEKDIWVGPLSYCRKIKRAGSVHTLMQKRWRQLPKFILLTFQKSFCKQIYYIIKMIVSLNLVRTLHVKLCIGRRKPIK